MSSGFANVRQGLAISAGSGSVSTGVASFVNSNGVTFGASKSASSLVITASAQTVAGGVASYSAGTTQVTSGTAVLSNVGGLSFGANGQTITAALPGIQYWDNSLPQNIIFNIAGIGANDRTVGLRRQSIGLPLTATRADVLLQFVNAGALSAFTTVQLTFSILVYTFNHSTLSLASSGTLTSTYFANGGGQTGGFNSLVSIPIGTWNVTPGEYVLGTLAVGASSILSGSTLSDFTANCGGSSLPATIRNPGGGNFSPYIIAGIYSASTTAAPNSIQLSDVIQTFTQSIYMQPFIRLVST